MKKFISLMLAVGGLAIFPGCQTAAPLAASPEKNTYVLVPGAWGGGWDWRHVDDLLTADGNKIFRSTLTGLGERVHLASTNIDLDTHIQDVVNVILWEDLHDVVLVGHSYGGMVVTGVADRVPERLKRVVYVDAMLPENGESVLTAMPPAHANRWQIRDGFVLSAGAGRRPPHDVAMPLKCFTEPIFLAGRPAKFPATYILTVDAGQPPAQDEFYKFYQRAQARGWPVSVMAGDHNVQRTHPQELVRRLEKAAQSGGRPN